MKMSTDDADKQVAHNQLAVALGARPLKKPTINYKVLKVCDIYLFIKCTIVVNMQERRAAEKKHELVAREQFQIRKTLIRKKLKTKDKTRKVKKSNTSSKATNVVKIRSKELKRLTR
jgi:hypothetical protein